MIPSPPIILASASPRRRILLEALGLDFDVRPTSIDENAITAASPHARALKIAAAKALASADDLAAAGPDSISIAADTIVVLDGREFGKPRDRVHAAQMLAELSGRTHEVVTAIAIRAAGGAVWLDAERTFVHCRAVSTELIENYVATGAADDKAGGYGIQEIGREFIERIEGDASNVIGLPLERLRRGLAEMVGLDLLADTDLRTATIRAFPAIEAFISPGEPAGPRDPAG